MNVLDLVRPDLRSFAGYSSARRAGANGRIWLNANESPWVNPADAGARCNRYPEPQPDALRQALADLYRVRPDQLLIGRGSDEAIDLLVRSLCRPERDAVLVASPVFGMYAVSARLQNAPLIDVPLLDGPQGFAPDLAAIGDAALAAGARLVFLCSPGNPTGEVVALADVAALASRLAGTSIVVVDEAYGEFSELPSAITLLDQHPNLAVLRTLSKAHALAGARIGSLIATPELVEVLRNCQAPYPLPTPCVDLALAALTPEALARTRERIDQVREERERLAAVLRGLPGVRRVYPSQGNFLLVRFDDAQRAWEQLIDAGVVVRDQRAVSRLEDALRISIGTPKENEAVILALSGMKEPAA